MSGGTVANSDVFVVQLTSLVEGSTSYLITKEMIAVQCWPCLSGGLEWGDARLLTTTLMLPAPAIALYRQLRMDMFSSISDVERDRESTRIP